MSHEEKTILTNMCMVYDDQGNVLVEDRSKPEWPGITFPGGHVEHGESFVASVIREVKEETGLDIERPVLCGIKQWYEKEDVRYVVMFFKTNRFSGTIRSLEEGEVYWMPREQLRHCQLAQDMDEMIEIFESDDRTEFYYYYNEDAEDIKGVKRKMKRELGIARCGLACCLCSENVSCQGCNSGNCGERDCVNRKCSQAKGLKGCWECPEECRLGLLQKIKPYGFTQYIKRYGTQKLLERLEENEKAGVRYHVSGIVGDYDNFDDVESLIQFIDTGISHSTNSI